MRISDWSSDVCSSDLLRAYRGRGQPAGRGQISILDQRHDRRHAERVRRRRDRDEGKLVARLGRLAQGARSRNGAGDARARAGQGQAQGDRGRAGALRAGRSDERRVGKAGVSTWNYRWVPYTQKKKEITTNTKTIN